MYLDRTTDNNDNLLTRASIIDGIRDTDGVVVETRRRNRVSIVRACNRTINEKKMYTVDAVIGFTDMRKSLGTVRIYPNTVKKKKSQ